MIDILKQYEIFVDGVTSETSKNNKIFIERIQELDKQGIDIARLLTGSLGLMSESSELAEVVKKCLFHGKPLNEENLTHLKKELGDVCWYFTNVCIALGIDIETVMRQNIKKLEARYPGGQFNIERAENRAKGDI